MEKWSIKNMGSLFGKTAVISPIFSDAAMEVACELCQHGAEVIICGEDQRKGEKALEEIRSSVPGAFVTFKFLDLSDLSSIRALASELKTNLEELHLLINMSQHREGPKRQETIQGHEMMFATNYLGHFALTAQLFPLIQKSDEARIIFQSSLDYREAMIDIFDLNATHYYEPYKAFAQSQLATLIFARELNRRMHESDLEIKSMAVFLSLETRSFVDKIPKIIRRFLPEKSPSGVETSLPLLFAATSIEAQSGEFYGPHGKHEVSVNAKNIQAAEKLWEMSEDMCGVSFEVRNSRNILPFYEHYGYSRSSSLNPDLN